MRIWRLDQDRGILSSGNDGRTWKAQKYVRGFRAAGLVIGASPLRLHRLTRRYPSLFIPRRAANGARVFDSADLEALAALAHNKTKRPHLWTRLTHETPQKGDA